MLFSRRSSRPRGLAALLPGRALLAALLLALLAPLAQAEDGKRLRIGITLHPYYSYVSNIVGDKAEVVPLIPAGFNPHAYEPRAEDIKRIGTLDVVVLNGVGHDDFAERMIASSEKPGIPVIEANAKVPLLAATGMAARGAGKVVNPHTFLSISASITQVNTIARELGKLDPANAKAYTRNARAYAKRLRALRADALARLNKAPAADFRVATIHGAYDYLLREFGLEVTAVVEPAHGIEPSPSQLKKTIDQLKALDVKVIFSEIDFLHLRRDHPARVRGEALFAVAHFLWRLQRRQVRGRNGAQPRHRGPRHPGVRRMTVAERLCATPCGPAIEFAGIDLSLGGSRILDGVRLRVEAGSVHALVGPNGGGKSSLVKTLLGQMPHRGELRLEWPGAPGCIGYVPQALEFDRGLPLTVDDFMAAMCQRRPAFLGLSRSRRPAIDAALERVGMLAKRGRRMGALSGGERQRVLLAQGLVPPPQLLVLDEPMSALDEGGIQVFERLLLDWRQAGVTVLWIEHDLEAVGRLADRVSGLNRHLLFDGPAASSLTPERLLTLFSTQPRKNAEASR